VSIDKNILHGLLLKKIDEPWIRILIEKILFNDPTKNCLIKGKPEELASVPYHKSLWHAPKNKGLPIGNLTSQFFSNVYLNELDQFVKHRLKCKHYLRYVDDVVILDTDSAQLEQTYQRINRLLNERLCLNLHPHKKQINQISHGINFVGFVMKPHRKYIRRSTVSRLKEKIRQWKQDYVREEGVVPEESWMQYRAMLNSYYGLFRWANAYKLREALAKKARNERVFPDADYAKFYLRPLN
jgi:hypothetical protein